MAVVMSPSHVADALKNVFGLRDGIKEMTLHVDRKEATLTVVYFAGDGDGKLAESLEEFRLVKK